MYDPKPEHKFTFGLWTIANPGRDPFGEPVRAPSSQVRHRPFVGRSCAWGVNCHDNDLVPIATSPAERDKIVADFKKALDETGLVVPMATTNLFSDPVFRDGAFTSNDPKVRAYALQKNDESDGPGCRVGSEDLCFLGWARRHRYRRRQRPLGSGQMVPRSPQFSM